MSPVEVNKECRKQNCKEIDQREHHQPVSHGQHAHITQRKEQYQSDQWQIEGREDDAYDSRCIDDAFFA